MESACGVSGDLVQVDSVQVSRCHDHTKALRAVQVKTAAFKAKLDVLAAEKIRFEASISDTVKEMTEKIKEKADTVIERAEVGKKIHALQKLLEEAAAPLTSSAAGAGAKPFLNDAINAVKTAGGELSDSLDGALTGVGELLTKCNRLFTGVGPEKEYLLDMCSQTSATCIEKEKSRHAGCCCGYLPLLALGKDPPTHTIPGVSAASAGEGGTSTRARVADRRRLQGAKDDGVYPVCAESYQQSKDQVRKAEEEVRKLGQAHLLAEAAKAQADKYPDYFGGCG